MRRREDRAIQKHTMNLYAGDYPKLQVLYPRIGAAKAIRDIVHAHIRKIEENAAQLLIAPDQDLVFDLNVEINEDTHESTLE